MSTVEKWIDVNVPVTVAYNQWTQFEEFPRFMEGVEEVRQISEKDLHWRVNIGGKRKEFETVIDHFKEYVEERGAESGAWRGTVHGDRTSH